jgi:hypothetical protein
MANCDILEVDPVLLARPYKLQSRVSAAKFQLFVKAIEGSDPELTHESCPELRLLCDEFKVVGLRRKIQTFTDRWTSVVFGDETVHIERGTLVQTCRKFHDCQSL